jgi:hypothetical protein
MKIVRENAANPSLNTMNHRDRGHFVSDIFNAAQVKLVPYSTACEAAKYLREEKHFLPWFLVYKYLRTIRSMIDESRANCYRKYIVHLLRPQYHETTLHKTTLVEQLKFQVFQQYARYIHSKRKSYKYDEGELDELLKKYKNATPEQRAGINIQVRTTDPGQVEKIGNVQLKYLSTSISSIVNFVNYYSSKAPEAVWHIYRDHYKLYNDKYGLAQFEYASTLKNMIKHQRNDKDISEIEQFFKSNTAGAGHLGVLNGLEEAKFIRKFKRESEPELKAYLEKQSFCQNL